MKSSVNDELFHVEHSYWISRLSKLFVLAICLLLPACKSEDPNPQLKDPIYNDLVKEYANAQSLVEKEEKKLEGLEKDLFKAEVRTIERRSAQKDIDNSHAALRKYQQQAEYFRIAIIKREVEARAGYKRAFASEKEWPDKKEYENYKQDLKMRAVSRNWSERVPRPQNPLNEVKEAKGKEGGEGEGAEKKTEGESKPE